MTRASPFGHLARAEPVTTWMLYYAGLVPPPVTVSLFPKIISIAPSHDQLHYPSWIWTLHQQHKLASWLFSSTSSRHTHYHHSCPTPHPPGRLLKRRDTATTSTYLSRKQSNHHTTQLSTVVPFSALSVETTIKPRSNTDNIEASLRHIATRLPTAHPRIHFHTVERQPRRRGSTNPAFAVTRYNKKEASPARPTSESSTQHHHHHHQATAPRKQRSSSPSTIPRAADDSSIIITNNHKMAPMSTSAEAAATATATTTYYMVPNLRAIDPSAREVDLGAYAWVRPIVIEDEDLMFGGKSLSTLYEEERRRQSTVGGGSIAGGGCSSDEENHEERRGRERVRRQYSPPKSHRK